MSEMIMIKHPHVDGDFEGQIIEQRKLDPDNVLLLVNIKDPEQCFAYSMVPVIIDSEGNHFSPYNWNPSYHKLPDDDELSDVIWTDQGGIIADWVNGRPVRCFDELTVYDFVHDHDDPDKYLQSWGGEDVEELLGMIAAVEDHGLSYDAYKLPSVIEIPERLAVYPIWSIDARGMCLVGSGVDEIESLDSIIKWYSNLVPETETQPREFSIFGFEKLEKMVMKGNESSGRIFLPKDWMGCRVAIIRMSK